MNNTIRKIKNMKYTKLVIGIIIGVIIAGTSVYYAATIYYDSINVGYVNTVSGLDANNVQDALDELCNIASDNFVNRIYPVGSIYVSTSLSTPTQVANALGGTWESFGAGRTLIGAGTGKDSNNTSKTFAVNSTGGEYEHTLTIGQIPSHNHTVEGLWKGGETRTGNKYVVDGYPQAVATGKGQYNVDTNSKGNNQSHNNIQPYITVYMYKRIS